MKELWEQYQGYTKDLTDFSRKLGFGGIAVCWVLKLENGTFSDQTIRGLVFVVAFFLFDVLQGLTAAIVLRVWIRRQEKVRWASTGTLDGEYSKPYWIDYPAYLFFLLKISALLLSFVFIGLELLSRQ